MLREAKHNARVEKLVVDSDVELIPQSSDWTFTLLLRLSGCSLPTENRIWVLWVGHLTSFAGIEECIILYFWKRWENEAPVKSTKRAGNHHETTNAIHCQSKAPSPWHTRRSQTYRFVKTPHKSVDLWEIARQPSQCRDDLLAWLCRRADFRLRKRKSRFVGSQIRSWENLEGKF